MSADNKNAAANDSDSDDDYMSASVLAACDAQDKASGRHQGLKMTYSKQREHKLLKRRAELQSLAQENREARAKKGRLEAERREEGLETRLDESNKGFAMLQKMGYKPGESLGGRVDPVPIAVKSDRGGLGRDAVLAEIRERKVRMLQDRIKRQREEAMTAEQFRAHHSRQRRLALTQSDLYKSQKSCRQLDEAKGFDKAGEDFFWPKEVKDEGEEEEVEEDEEEKLEPEEQLNILTGYLRLEHQYCVWCGCRYSDAEDLRANCPGEDREARDE